MDSLCLEEVFRRLVLKKVSFISQPSHIVALSEGNNNRDAAF